MFKKGDIVVISKSLEECHYWHDWLIPEMDYLLNKELIIINLTNNNAVQVRTIDEIATYYVPEDFLKYNINYNIIKEGESVV